MDTIIKDIEIKELGESKYIRPFSIHFVQDGIKRKWDCIKAHDSVSCLLYHTERDAFLFVKQFRPSLWYYQKQNGINSDELGISYEFCAGLCDKGLDEKRTMIEEIFEETGYATNDVRYITSSFTGLGFSANRQSIFYALIDESMKRGAGGGIDDEKIELCFIERAKINEFLLDESKPKGAGALFGITWFLANF
ncbi:Nudix-type nucleoside diphosphatase, YffH/AdpP family [Candidatus Campylobacter infans]|uniref:Nudix-type nucleoside diphosphatase, YffH/AdpP family n=1 Tax=Candidatus Campylobacter infans TaxID=2561898 RepID=A0A7H9CKX2_9BACT|nr:NUDIX hydrolase [Candidatus Campylobacter infans]QLI05459.1 Nudix-type nucleoside diphosphatase, YffH/AdpP family [Candidatus Campylobacter infans]